MSWTGVHIKAQWVRALPGMHITCPASAWIHTQGDSRWWSRYFSPNQAHRKPGLTSGFEHLGKQIKKLEISVTLSPKEMYLHINVKNDTLPNQWKPSIINHKLSYTRERWKVHQGGRKGLRSLLPWRRIIIPTMMIRSVGKSEGLEPLVCSTSSKGWLFETKHQVSHS